MAKYTKVNGKYVINGNRYQTLEGTRAQVWHGTAYKTSGGLKKDDLIQNKGRIVSKSKHQTAKKEMRLVKAGYGTKKGKFGYVILSSKGKGKKSRSRSRSKAMRGGSGMKSLSNMAEVSGMQGTAAPGSNSNDVQMRAGNATV
jgi:hypothetical protein